MPVAAAAPPSQGAPGQKKRRKRKDSDSLSSEEGGTFEVYQSAAMTFQNTGQFSKAIDTYTKALELREGDKNCLVARSQCHLQLGDADKALKDAEETLKDDKSYIKGILQQAESYYQKGQFEYALMHFHRGNKLRPEVQAFRLGIQKSQEAIDNSIGGAASIKLTKEGDLSYFYEEQQKAAQASQQQQKRGGYGRPQTRERKKQKQSRAQSHDQKTVKQLLGDLYADKEYLEQLLKETENAGNKSETNQEVHTLAQDCLNYLDTRTQFWQQQKPLYSRKPEKKKKEKTKGAKKSVSDWVLMRLEQIDDAQAEGRYEDSLKLSKKTLKEVDKVSDEDLQNRPEVVANLHSCLGNAYLELGEYNKSLHHHTTDEEIGKQHDLEESQSRSLDNLGRVYARMGEYEKAIDIWEKKLPIIKTALECTWLYHEIGRCYLELKKYEDAKEYGEKSYKAAQEADDEVWQLNATVLIAQCEVKTGEFQAAVDSFDRALEMAKVQGDKAAESAIRRAIEDVNKKIVEEIKDHSSSDEEGGKGEKEDKDKQEEQKQEEKKEEKGGKDGEEEGEAKVNYARENTVQTQVQKDKTKEQKEASSKDTKDTPDSDNEEKKDDEGTSGAKG